jgi:hypothetical protein
MKIGIGGIKFSGELVQISQRALLPSDASFVDLLRDITAARINIPYGCSSVYGNEIVNTFCVAVADFVTLERLLQNRSKLLSAVGRSSGDDPTIIRRVGTLTIFPHRRSFAMLGRIVAILDKSTIRIYGLCTSISAIAINIDYQLLDSAAEVLKEIVELPDNHAPFRPEFCVRQVSA